MACFSPLTAYRSRDVNASGKRSMVFNVAYAIDKDVSYSLPCGQCIGCRLKYSAQWAARCHHESLMHSDNCFLTLTFNDEHLPKDGSVSVRDCQLFLKRLRKFVFPQKLRYAYCGEYGELFLRPHYHFLIFGFDFKDKYLWSQKNGSSLFRSPQLEKLWPFGNSLIGSVSFESSAYVARYMIKKQKGKDSWLKYMEIDPSTGEILRERSKEFFHTSRRPGIGRPWLDKFSSDVYPKDYFNIDGREISPPRFYDNFFEKIDPLRMDDIRAERELSASRWKFDSTPERLTVREKVKLAEIRTLTRSFESGS